MLNKIKGRYMHPGCQHSVFSVSVGHSGKAIKRKHIENIEEDIKVKDALYIPFVSVGSCNFSETTEAI